VFLKFGIADVYEIRTILIFIVIEQWNDHYT